MPLALQIYLVCWLAACAGAALLYLRNIDAFAISHRRYWRFLLKSWKFIIFIIAAAGITLMAPHSGDPTWDYYDGFFMSCLTYATAPWSVGILYRAIKGKADTKQLYVAACLWMFSASWSYDLYLLLRDGLYPSTWLPNIAASSFLYLLAGCLWNLAWQREKEKGLVFAFMQDDWPNPLADGNLLKIATLAFPIILLVAGFLLYFFLPFLGRLKGIGAERRADGNESKSKGDLVARFRLPALFFPKRFLLSELAARYGAVLSCRRG